MQKDDVQSACEERDVTFGWPTALIEFGLRGSSFSSGVDELVMKHLHL